AARLDAAMTTQWRRVQEARGERPTRVPPSVLPPGTMTFGERDARGAVVFDEGMTFPPPDPDIPYSEVGVRGFVFGAMWDRPGLTRKERRFITLAGGCAGGGGPPVPFPVHAPVDSGDGRADEGPVEWLRCG